MTEERIIEDVSNFLTTLNMGMWDDLGFEHLSSPVIIELVNELKMKIKLIEQLMNQLGAYSKLMTENFSVIQNITEKSAMKIVNLAEEVMNVSDSEDMELLQDRAFQIITSVEFQDIIQQRIDNLRSTFLSIENQHKKVSDQFPYLTESHEIEMESEPGSTEGDADKVLSNQDLVDQLLAEFGVGN